MLFPLIFSKRIPKWVHLKAYLSSISCTNTMQVTLDINQRTPSTSDFDANIQSLRHKLCPDSLIKVLNSTSDVNSAIKIFQWAALQKQFYHTADTYYWIIFKLGMNGNAEEMEGFCQNMVKDRCPAVEHVLVSLVDAFVRNCRLNEAMRVLVHVNRVGFKPSVDVFNIVLCALVEENRGFRDVVFVYKEMVKAGVVPSVDTLNHLIGVLFEIDRLDSALGQYRRMKKKGCSPNSRTFEIVIKGLISKNKVDDSIIILHEMLELGCLPEFSFYKCIIPLFCQEDKLEEGIKLFRMMRDSNFTPDSFVYGALIQCLCKHLRLDEAVNLLEEMMESCLTPSSSVWTDMVNGFCNLGKISEAILLLQDKNVLETSPHNALLRGCCVAGRFLEAKVLLEKMLERNIDDFNSWNILFRWLCEKAEIRKAYEVLGRMIMSSFLPDCTTYSALVAGNCMVGKYKDALQLFLQLRAKCWTLDPASYSELIEGLCRAEKYLEAVEAFRYMSENRSSLQPLAFDMLIKCICNIGMADVAVRLQLLAYNSGTSCANGMYNYVMLGLSKSDQGKHTLPFLSQMLVQGSYLDAEGYCTLIQSMIAQNHTRNSALFLNVMVNEGMVPESDTLNNLLSYLAKHSQLYLISASIDKLVSDGEVLDSTMYSILVNGLWKEGNESKARQLLDKMLEKGWVPDAATHGLLIGSADGEETVEGTLTYEDLSIRDSVSDILAEGFGET